ncbi:hypothetical protein NA56DRAFT_284512 [Hyaloscypha hepaticicola]|uniref:Uncharacterized protein n=1 Tax=Hyaloscypha hepaticicola TaxID=2082293 RepID=A0A2J6PSL6_9HELO|nr:hypothetical protein NA56DRAFT_284512 [Hyaloscypha hepaticicola]
MLVLAAFTVCYSVPSAAIVPLARKIVLQSRIRTQVIPHKSLFSRSFPFLFFRKPRHLFCIPPQRSQLVLKRDNKINADSINRSIKPPSIQKPCKFS